MSHLRLIPEAREVVDRLLQTRQVLILHPRFRYQTALVDSLLNKTTRSVLYATLQCSDDPLADLWQTLSRELADLHQLSLPTRFSSATPRALAEQFCQAIKPLSPLTVVLAAYDCADDRLHEFVAQAALDGGQFVVAGRVWPYQLVEQIADPARLAILPVSPEHMLLDYLDTSADSTLLEVRALGYGQVLVNGREIDHWDGALPRALFFYFVDRGITTRDEVFSTFWPELSTREATNVFHVTKRKISEILGVDLTIYSSGFYRISPLVALNYDTITFVEAVQNSAIAEPTEAIQLLERAITLHERPFLTDFDQPWAVRRRDELLRTHVEALVSLARLYEEQGQVERALGLYIRAFGVFPQREDLARAQMRLYQETSRAQWALAVYDSLAEELQRSLGVTPDPESVALAEVIRQQCS